MMVPSAVMILIFPSVGVPSVIIAVVSYLRLTAVVKATRERIAMVT